MERFLRQAFLLIMASIAALSSEASSGASADESLFTGSWNSTFFTIDGGLPHNFVDDLMRDSNGFMWIAMQGGGLVRYDGYGYLHFTPASERYKIKSAFVAAIAEDSFRRLWLTSDIGVDVIDLNTLGNVCPAAPEDTVLRRLFTSPAKAVRTDADGNVWVQSERELVCLTFDKASGKPAGHVAMPLPPDRVNNLLIKSKGAVPELYMAISGRLWRIGLDSGGHISRQPMNSNLTPDPGILVSDVLETGNELWIATDMGLFRYNEAENMVKRYVHDAADPTSLSQNCVTSLSLTPDKRLAVGSLLGINIYNSISDSFEWICETGAGSQNHLLNSNFVNCMLSDGDRLWVGTEGGGVTLISTRMLHSRMLLHKPGDERSLSAYPVNVIYQDEDGTLFVGTVEGGLNRRRAGASGFDHFTVSRNALSHNSVSALAADDEGRLWIGTWGGGVNVTDRKNPLERKALLTVTDDGQDISYIGVVIHDPINNGVWIGSNRGLWFCDSEFHTFVPFDDNEATPVGCIGARIDRNGHLWIGGSNGLFDINLKERRPDGTFPRRHLRYRLDDPDSKVPERISYVHEDAGGNLWFGSNGYGIYRRETGADGTETFVNYNVVSGLASDMVRGMLDDSEGNLWVATYHGLSCLTPGGRIINFDSSDGIGSGQFYWNAACRTADGKLMFGSVDGLLVLDGGIPHGNKSGDRVLFTRLFVGNEEATAGRYSQSDISITPGITLHERNKSFSVEFSALDFSHAGGLHYYYRLYPFENEWIELPSDRHYVSYTNIPSGDYTLEVRYAGSPEELGAGAGGSLAVTVRPFFYKTIWFYFIVACLAGGVVWLYLRRKTRHLRAQTRRLEATVDQRAKELKESHAELQRATEQNDMQQTRIADMNRKVQEMTMDRITFFTSITHEFRTPITLIIGPIQRALKLSRNPEVIEQLHYVERNSKYLLSLVNQLMDFRKVESGKLEIVRSRGNFLRYADEILTPFDLLAAERGITIRRVYHMPTPEISYDDDALRKVLTNLLGNAVKFTPDGGVITVYVALLPTRPDYTLLVSVSDTGGGIAPQELEFVFDRFFQGKSQMHYPVAGSLGSGIGLYLCKNIIEVYGGSISVRNNRNGVGCTFRITLPVPPDDGGASSVKEQRVVPGSLVTNSEQPSDGAPHLVVLVVEDVADMRSFIASVLRDRYTVIEASNGEEALKILLERQVDFIISDLMMPVMDGLELSRRVKENFAISHIPFLMLTAKTSAESRIESYRVGVDEYLLKPFDEQLLLARISNILDNKRRYQSKFNMGMDVDSLNIQEESRDKKFIDDTMEVIRKNYKNSYFEVGDFAEALGISRSLLNKKLQNLVGQSAGHLIRTFRMKMARELIMKNRVTRQMNISEIAYEVGFNDSKYFTRCFTKHFGVTPSAMMNDGAPVKA